MKNSMRDHWLNQVAIQELYYHHIDPICQKYRLSRIELDILIFLSKYPEYNRAADIVKYRGFSKSYVSLSVKSLADRQLLEGMKNENDNKNIHLSLLPDSAPIIEESLAAQQTFCSIIYEGFEKEEIEKMLLYSGRLTENVKKATAKIKNTKKSQQKASTK